MMRMVDTVREEMERQRKGIKWEVLKQEKTEYEITGRSWSMLI